MSDDHHSGGYYVPAPSHWPIVGSLALFCFFVGAANWLHGNTWGPYLFVAGICILLFMMWGWFGTVIRENQAGKLADPQVDRSFRWGMAWFIFSEVMFFATFFGTLWYVRNVSVPQLGGLGSGLMTHVLLWSNFTANWPLLQTPDPSQVAAPTAVMETWHIPAINTLILLTSGLTITIAHWGIIENKHRQAIIAQGLTILLGIAFLCMQAREYTEAYTLKGLKLSAGVYGNTFFLLTGFHALHVTLGTIMLIVIWFRIYKKHFSAHNHFAFEAVAWYWHFVDVVWLLLFIFVYWI